MEILETPGRTLHRDSGMSQADEQRLVDQVRPCPCCGSTMIYTPVILCSHCGQELPIRCYVFQRKGKYYGECLTLNLISRGDTQAEAILKLQGLMYSYVTTVFEGDQPTKGLIPRRAPLSSWVRYYAHVFSRRFARIFGRRYALATQSAPSPDAIRYTVAEC